MPEDQYNSTTQMYLDVFDITNDLLIMKDGTTSVILTVDAMNFGLLAEEEQDAVMYAYAGLLNSLNYPIQVVVRSQTKDVTTYLQLLKTAEDESTTRLQQDNIRKYREFVGNLIRERNVLDKKFYVVIPATALELGILPAQSVLPGSKTYDASTIDRTVLLEKARTILEPKRDHMIAQFARIGLYSRQLATQEIIQLFYLSYNPEAAEGQQITDSSNYTTPLVSATVERSVRAQRMMNLNELAKTADQIPQPQPTFPLADPNLATVPEQPVMDQTQPTMQSESVSLPPELQIPVAPETLESENVVPPADLSVTPGELTQEPPTNPTVVDDLPQTPPTYTPTIYTDHPSQAMDDNTTAVELPMTPQVPDQSENTQPQPPTSLLQGVAQATQASTPLVENQVISPSSLKPTTTTDTKTDTDTNINTTNFTPTPLGSHPLPPTMAQFATLRQANSPATPPVQPSAPTIPAIDTSTIEPIPETTTNTNTDTQTDTDVDTTSSNLPKPNPTTTVFTQPPVETTLTNPIPSAEPVPSAEDLQQTLDSLTSVATEELKESNTNNSLNNQPIIDINDDLPPLPEIK